jgi:hypothetical protein
LNLRPSGYEPDELPLLHPATKLENYNRFMEASQVDVRPFAMRTIGAGGAPAPARTLGNAHIAPYGSPPNKAKL